MLRNIYLGIGGVVILIYVISNLIGFEVSAPKETQSLGIMRMTKSKPLPVSSGGGPYSTGSGSRGGK